MWMNFLFSTGFVEKIFALSCAQEKFPQSTGVVDKFFTIKGRCYFLVTEQESNQRTQLKEALRKGALLKNPPAASPVRFQNSTDFTGSIVNAAGVSKGGAFARSAPLVCSFDTFLAEARKVCKGIKDRN